MRGSSCEIGERIIAMNTGELIEILEDRYLKVGGLRSSSTLKPRLQKVIYKQKRGSENLRNTLLFRSEFLYIYIFFFKFLGNIRHM